MKKFNKNILLFGFSICFIALGFFSLDMLSQIGDDIAELFNSISSGDISAFSVFTDNINNDSSKRLSYHNQIMDLNSIKDNILGTKIIPKDEDTIIKTKSGSLINKVNQLPKSEIENNVNQIAKLQKLAESNGASFLYCAAPPKENFETTQVNSINYSKSNFDQLLSELKANQIPYTDFNEIFGDDINSVGRYYYTDHHWTSLTGFYAYSLICKNLKKRYGFEYKKMYIDLENFSVQTYPDWFLGSYGKKVGTYFTWNGADDFELIFPKFQTNLTEEQPFEHEVRNGRFEDTVLFFEKMRKDYYGINSYAMYSGGNSYLQIMKNNMNPSGKKILMIRDSFACVVAPFLALQSSELHVCDLRNLELPGERINVKDYIEQMKPDYVLVLYSGINYNADGRYNFF